MDSAKRTVYYDDTCELCEGAAQKIHTDIDADIVGGSMELPERIDKEALMRDVHAIDEFGNLHKGIDAVIIILRWHPRWFWVAPIIAFPLIRYVGAGVYRMIASNRHRWFRRR